jgi:hypothetical protein
MKAAVSGLQWVRPFTERGEIFHALRLNEHSYID